MTHARLPLGNSSRAHGALPVAVAIALLMAASAQATVYNWNTGNYSSTGLPPSYLAADVLNISVGGYKYLNASVTSAGTTTMVDGLYMTSGNTFGNSGLFDVQADVGFTDGGYSGALINSGIFRKSAGVGATTFANIGFTNNGGVIDAQSGSINFSSGTFNFNNGTQFTGAGQSILSGNASFAGNLAASNLTISAGIFTGTASVVSGTVNWSGGQLGGDWTLAAGQRINLQSGGYKYLNGSLTNQGKVAATDTLYLLSNNLLANQGLFDLQGDIGLGDGGYGGSFINTGTLRKSAGTGTSNVGFGGTGFTNNGGTIDAQTGTINFNTGALNFNDGTAFTGAGQVVVSGGANFAGTITGNNLTLAGATYKGTGAVFSGNVAWTGGTLTGDWTMPSGKTLALQSGGYHYLNGTLTNVGTIAADATLYMQSNNMLSNQGVYDLQGDIGLGDGGYGGNFINTGTLRKSVGTGISYVGFGGSGFTNNGGTIDAQTGTINFNSGPLHFNDGTLFKGDGQNIISGNATFTGNITSQNLQLASATFTGGNGSAGSEAVFAGTTTWTNGGSLNGNIELAAAHTLSIQAGGNKYVNGSLTNNGLVNTNDTVYVQSGNKIVNNGSYDVQADVGIGDGGYGGSFVNNGLFVKSAGAGTTNVSGIGFVNNGTVQVVSGYIQLPANFNNVGTLKGSGSFTTNLLTNDGHVAPGNSPGTLSLNGNFAQTSLGRLDIELQNLGSFDKFVVTGSASLAGTLALSCFSSCSFALGQTFTILDAAPNALTGTFASVTMSGFASGAFHVIYDAANGDVMLQVTQGVTAAVPENQTWALLLSGLGALGFITRRRSV